MKLSNINILYQRKLTMNNLKGQNEMKFRNKIFKSLLFFTVALILALNISATDYVYSKNKSEKIDLSEIELCPGGMPFGVKIQTKGLQVIKFNDGNSPAKNAGIKLGDIIIKINNSEIRTIEDFTKEINKFQGKEVKITVLRDGQELNFKIKPLYDSNEGKYKTGVWIKDSTSGIGTVTFINPETNEFGGLGHGICDSLTGNIIPLSRGIALDVTVNGVVKGQIGKAGELKGVFNAKKIGVLNENSSCGVFGYLSADLKSPEDKMKLCPKEELKNGEAYIWCTLGDEEPQKYSIQISDICLNNSGPKNFKVKITDKRLLERSGGIVQGMSGSPIIQDGRLVGAVTHVLINDPTSGYGIFIENMLNVINQG